MDCPDCGKAMEAGNFPPLAGEYFVCQECPKIHWVTDSTENPDSRIINLNPPDDEKGPPIKVSDFTRPQIGGEHYQGGDVEPIDLIKSQKLDFCEGNVVKYVCRHRRKNGKEDLLKARQYIDFLLEEYNAE